MQLLKVFFDFFFYFLKFLGNFDSTRKMFHKDYEKDRQISIDKWQCLTSVDHKLHQSSVSSYKKYINSIRYKLVVDHGKATLFVGAKCYHRKGVKKVQKILLYWKIWFSGFEVKTGVQYFATFFSPTKDMITYRPC